MCLVPQCSQITVLIAKAARPDRTKQKIRPIDSALHTNLNYTFFVAIVFFCFLHLGIADLHSFVSVIYVKYSEFVCHEMQLINKIAIA